MYDFCHTKFERESFNAVETEIFSLLGCEIETPHILEFTTYYFKVLRFFLQLSNCNVKTVETYLGYTENLAKFYCRMLMIDVEMSGL